MRGLTGGEAASQEARLEEDRAGPTDESSARVGDNFRAGRIRMVFAADIVPTS